MLVAAALAGCGKGERDQAQTPPPGGIVRVGERVLTQADLETLLPEAGRAALSPEERSRFIDRWVELEVFYSEAVRRGLHNDPMVRARIEKLEKEFLADHLVFLELRESINVSEEEIAEYYENSEREYRLEYRVSHILVNTLEEAENIRELLKTRSFSWVADRYSVDPVARRGGDLGYLTKGNMIPEFESVVFGLEAGQVSDIVRSDFGYHIIKLIGTREAQVKVTLDEVRERIFSTLLMEKRKKAYDEFYDRMMGSADIEYFEVPQREEPQPVEVDTLLPAEADTLEQAGADSGNI